MLGKLARIWRAVRREFWPEARKPARKAFPWLDLDTKAAARPAPYGMVLFETDELIHYANGVGGVVSVTKRRRTPPRRPC